MGFGVKRVESHEPHRSPWDGLGEMPGGLLPRRSNRIVGNGWRLNPRDEPTRHPYGSCRWYLRYLRGVYGGVTRGGPEVAIEVMTTIILPQGWMRCQSMRNNPAMIYIEQVTGRT
jgi:hypothetical protein